jgi:hypothetical protein
MRAGTALPATCWMWMRESPLSGSTPFCCSSEVMRPCSDFELAFQQAGLHVAQHLPRRQQRLQFPRADPDTRQVEGTGRSCGRSRNPRLSGILLDAARRGNPATPPTRRYSVACEQPSRSIRSCREIGVRRWFRMLCRWYSRSTFDIG